MFKKICIANRGEIAVRVIRTCREMGITTVALYSEADSKAVHVLEADEAVSLGSAEPAESYLNIEKILQAVKETGAEAVHPGYGFLAENPEFAAACEKAGVVFIGPPSGVIRDLGNKIVARNIMVRGNVPVVPGAESDDPEFLAGEAEKIGFPVMIKAAAGGGGKGIRIVNSAEEMKDAAVSASREAQNAFGDGTIFVEKFLAKSRHVEFQVLADRQGHTIHVLERECSIQRRHQKIIEESPSTAVSPELRKRMGDAAVAAAKAAGYVNAGTVEFLLDEDGHFYFLEVNTRLQVEHPVTELITGIDLVRKQIEIAAGEPLTIKQEDIQGRGHAIECRIYAEDPEQDFFPSPGKVIYMKEPGGPGVRNDCGIYSGFTVPVEYDPILSKLVVHGETRDCAIERMACALRDYIIVGIKTPIPFLLDIMDNGAFKKGDTFTDFIEKNYESWKPRGDEKEAAAIAYIADEMSGKQNLDAGVNQEREVNSPWKTLGNWRQ